MAQAFCAAGARVAVHHRGRET
ncbi:MAG TPA: hypothetical protein VN617_08095 [Rhodoferax sp.]|nr:hypothetical protein [Rhodoferax sp.]